jgi:hypothetical protein
MEGFHCTWAWQLFCTHACKTMKEPSTVEGRLPSVLGMGACSHAFKQQKRVSTFCPTTLLFAMLE